MTGHAGRPSQLILDLPVQSATGADDFLVSPANEAATRFIDSWPDWPQPSAVLIGPPAAGKTHLARVWQSRSGASAVAASALSDATVSAFQVPRPSALLVEDIDRGIADERILFHLLNQARELAVPLLLTSRRPPGELDVSLPDLRSRLRALAVAAITVPDDALLGAVMVKLFADRQLPVDPPVIDYLLRHMDRSFEAALAMVAAIDALALARQRRVTRALAAEAVAAMTTQRSAP